MISNIDLKTYLMFIAISFTIVIVKIEAENLGFENIDALIIGLMSYFAVYKPLKNHYSRNGNHE